MLEEVLVEHGINQEVLVGMEEEEMVVICHLPKMVLMDLAEVEVEEEVLHLLLRVMEVLVLLLLGI